MKRMMQRQGQIEADGSPPPREAVPPRSRPATPRPELSVPGRVAEFAREVRSELRQVAWPTRPEVFNSATVVFITLVLLVVLIFLLDYAFSHSINFIYST